MARLLIYQSSIVSILDLNQWLVKTENTDENQDVIIGSI